MKVEFKKGFLFIFLAAALWSSTGVFSRFLFDQGLMPLAAGFWRNVAGTLMLFVFLLVKDRSLFYISRKDIPFFFFFGLLSVTLFNYFYLTTIDLISVAGAVVLIYTAPAFAALLAYGILKEPLTRRKILCVLLALAGAFLVMEGYNLASLRINYLGIMTGLAAGLTYAGYSIFGRKAATYHYHYWTVVFYAMLFGTLLLGIWNIPRGFYIPLEYPVIGALLLFSLLTSVLAYGFFNRGLQDVEASKASIVATAEVAMAVLWGVLFLQEGLVPWQVVGICMVLCAAFFIQESAVSKD
jgi:drug/metabolite transporter, DME family